MSPTIEPRIETEKMTIYRRTSNQEHNCDCPQSGFTILEMAVSIAIFAIVMGSIYGLLHVARGGRINTSNRAEVLQGVRVALNAVGRDAINAGVGYPNIGALIPDNKLTLVGGASDADTTLEFLTPVYAANNLNSVNGTLTDEVTFLYIDDAFNGGASLPISAISDASGTNSVLTVQAGFNNSPCSLGDLYLITGNNAAAIGMLTSKSGTNTLNFASTDPLGINSPGAKSAIDTLIVPASLLKLTWVTYWVSDEDGNGTGTGTLMRRVFGSYNASTNTLINWVDQPLAFGIEDLQIQYVLANGSVVDLPTSTQMADVRQIRATVSVRSPDVDPKTNQPYRSSVTSSYSTRNLVYEKL
jgi:prepilin-type N-terminal cleavage/methylation domain-containing protein